MLADMSSGDYEDWQAYFLMESDVQTLVSSGMDYTLAVQAVWGPLREGKD